MKKITLSFPIVIIISLVIQLAGLMRSLILANDFGASSSLDAFYLANVFTISIFTIIGSAVTTIVIPELNNPINENKRSGRRYIGGYLTVITAISLILSGLLFIILLLGKRQFAANFNNSIRQMFIVMTFILLISQQFRIQASFAISLFQNSGHYIIPRIMDIIPALLPIVYLIIVNKVDIVVLTVITALAYVTETIIFMQIQAKLIPNMVYKFNLYFDRNVKRMLISTIPILISSAVFQIQVLLSNYFAGLFGHGYITLLSNTNQVMGMFQSLFILNLINMIYPKMAKEFKRSIELGSRRVSTYISLTNAIVILLIWGYASVGHDLIEIMFVRGKFTESNADIVYMFSLILGAALPLDVIRNYSYRIYYSLGDTKTPMLNSLETVIINVVLLVIGYKIVGPYTLAIAPACGTAFSCFNIVLKTIRNKIRISFFKIFCNYIIFNAVGFTMYFLIKKCGVQSNNITARLALNILIGFCFVLVLLIVGSFAFLLYKKEKKKQHIL